MRRFVFVLSGLVLATGIVAAVVLGPYAFGVRHVEADPSAGFHADFYLYVSSGARATAEEGGVATLLVQPNNSGTNSDEPEVHRKDAWWTGFGRHALADELGVALLVPAFVRPSEDWHIYTHALDRDTLVTERADLRRLDLQLLAMVDRARSELAQDGLAIAEEFLLQGFSASGMFANRFTALHPERVKAMAAGSPGGWPLVPVAAHAGRELVYPAGVSDLEELTGRGFDAEAFAGVPQLFVMGSTDENDSVDFRDGWDEDAARLVDALFGETPLQRWDAAEALFREAGVDARFLLVEGVGHDRRSLQQHTTEFFRGILDAGR